MLARVPTAFIPVVLAGLRYSTDAMAAESPQPTDRVPPAHRFGEPGEVVISGATQTSFVYSTFHPGGSSQASAFVSTAADGFVVHGLSLGARFAFAHSAPDGAPYQEDVTIGPRVGYNITLSDRWSVWPDAFASYGVSWNEGGPIEGYNISVGIFAPILFHPVPHFFLGLGPMASTNVSWVPNGGFEHFERVQITDISLAADVGGWIGP